MNKKLILYVLILSPTFLLTTCNRIEDKTSKLFSEKQELKILLIDPVETLDPLKILFNSDWTVANNIYEGLFKFDENHEIVNALVDTFFISNGNLLYTFRLRDNVYFHDSPCFPNFRGRKLKSSDIKFTIERLATKTNKFNNWEIINNKIVGINEYYYGRKDHISGIKIIDSLNFQIRLKKPFSSFLSILTSPGFYIIPSEAIEYFKERFSQNPVGTGPFRISEFNNSDRIILVRNENYYLKDNNDRSLPYLQTMIYSTINKSENRFSELVKNNTHIINADQIQYNKFIKDSILLSNFATKTIDAGDGIRFWGFNFDKTNDLAFKELRKGIAMSLNREYLRETDKTKKIAETLVPAFYLQDNIKWYDFDENYDCDTDLIKASIDTVTVMANLVYNDLLEIEKALNHLKLPYKRIIKRANYYSQITSIKPTLFRVSMVPAFPDPIEYYSLFYSKNAGGINLGNFSNKQFDQIYEYVQTEINPSLQKEAYIKLEEILKDEIAAIYLTHQGPFNYIYSKNLKNIRFNYILPDFTKAYFD